MADVIERFFYTTYRVGLIKAAYRMLLRREADADGLRAYGAWIKSRKDFQRFLGELEQSDERRDRLWADMAPALVQALYGGLLGREAEPEFEAGYARLIAEQANPRAVVQELADSEEHWRRVLDQHAQELVQALYSGLLGSEAEAEHQIGYAQAITDKGLAPVVEEIAGSDEHWRRLLKQRAPDLAGSLHRGLFQREPEASAHAASAQRIAADGSLEAALTELGASDAYWQKSLGTRADQVVREIAEGLGVQGDLTQDDIARYAQELQRGVRLKGVVAAIAYRHHPRPSAEPGHVSGGD